VADSLPTLGWLGGIGLYMLAMAGTPGPNNLLLAASGLRYGFVRTLPFIAGILVGMTSQLALVAFGLGTILSRMPPLAILLKIAGTCYIVWLAVSLWRGAARPSDDSATRPLSLLRGAVLQYVNPKSWVAILTLVSTSLAGREPGVWEWAAAATVYVVTIGASCCAWAGFGTALRRLLTSARASRVVSRAFAVCVLISAALLWL